MSTTDPVRRNFHLDWSKPMTTPNTNESHLTTEQLARAEALGEARAVLACRGPLVTGEVDAIDLVNVASWILTGQDPWLDDAAETPEQSRR